MTYSYLYEVDTVEIPITKKGQIKHGFVPYVIEGFRASSREFILLRGCEKYMHNTKKSGIGSTNPFSIYICKNGYQKEMGTLVLSNGNILIFKGERIRRHGSK